MDSIPYGKQQITDDDISAVVSVLKSDFLTQGPRVEEFEKKICESLGCSYAVAVSNGTAALHLSALALDVKPGQKVLCTTNSFVASANCIEYVGGQVEFVDIDPKNFCIDIDKVRKIICSSPRGTYAGVVAVDFAGYPVDIQSLSKLCHDNGLWVLEDACHAFGGAYLNENQNWANCGGGTYADLAVFSFHPVKHIATGEGGVITTNSQQYFERLKELRTHGITRNPEKLKKQDGPWYYEMQQLGFNYRIPDILCALGTSQLKRIEKNIQRRNEIAERYNQALRDLPIELPIVTDVNLRHAYHLYVIQTQLREELYHHLKEHNIHPQVHYIPIHTQPYYVEKYGVNKLPVAEHYYQNALSLPMFHGLTDPEQEMVIQAVRNFFATR